MPSLLSVAQAEPEMLPGAPVSAEALAEILVQPGKASFDVGEPVDAALFIRNGRAVPLDVPRLDWEGTIHRLTDSGDLEPIYGRLVTSLEAGLASGEIDGQGIDELTFVHVDNPSGGNTAYYKQEWNGRYMSH